MERERYYWGFNALVSILQAPPPIRGALYMPVRSARTERLRALANADRHHIRVYHSKHPAPPQQMGAPLRYPLLITASPVGARHTFRTVADYLAASRRERELLLLLDGITDVGNIAAIVRSAYNFGVTCLVTAHRTGGDVPLLIRRSAGYYVQLSVVAGTNIARAIDTLKRSQFWVYGTASAGTPLSTLALDAARCALVVGDEQRGLRAQTKAVCDNIITIPHRAECESLNVAVATGIALYEIDRQRAAASSSYKSGRYR